MSNYVPLDEAAKRLGVSADSLVEMLSKGEIFGYRDGASWKFKAEEIERVQMERDGVISEDPSGSSLLLSENYLGPSGSKSGSTIGGDKSSGRPDSDLELRKSDREGSGSDVALVPDPSSGSGVRLVTRNNGGKKTGDSDALSPIGGDSDDDLQLIDDDGQIMGDAGSGSAIDIGSDLMLASGSGSAISLSDIAGSGINLNPVHSSDVLADSDAKLKLGSTGASGTGSSKIGSSGSLNLDGDLQIADDDDDDLVLGSGSDLALAADSGINLMSPSDSGLALDDEPLDLAGTGISGLDLATEGSDVSGAMGSAASASGSLVDFQQDEEFQLTPSGGMELDEDSGSQVIELEDSSEFAGGDVALNDPNLGGFGDDLGMAGFGAGLGGDGTSREGQQAVAQAAPDIYFGTFELSLILISLILLGMSGIIVTDLARNMWAWNETGVSDLTSGLTKAALTLMGR